MNIPEILNDPCTSYWLKNALKAAAIRDPVDAANDAEILAEVLRHRCDVIMNGEKAADVFTPEGEKLDAIKSIMAEFNTVPEEGVKNARSRLAGYLLRIKYELEK